MSIKCGSATLVINPEIGDDLSGHYHRRFTEHVRDDLEANALYLTDGTEHVMFINFDLAGLIERDYVREVCSKVEADLGMPERSIILCSTHTHAGPDTCGLLADAPKNDRYLESLKGWIAEVARDAYNSAQPAQVGWALGHAHIGFNRRVCWADGTHTMFGDTSLPEFTGIEGPDDPSHAAFFAYDMDGKPIAIMHNNCCHPTNIYQSFASADFPGEARRIIRDVIDLHIPILYLQGASGDITPNDLMSKTPYSEGERRLKEVGATLASETLRLMIQTPTTDSPILKHACEDIRLGIRLPSEDLLAQSRAFIEMGEEKAGRYEYINAMSIVNRLYGTYKDDPTELIALHAVRIGDFAISTNPCELFCQFGLDIKRRSPAGVTAVVQLANGFSGYCPTIAGLLGGGYSVDPIYWARLEDYAGYKIVETSAKLLHGLWH